MFKELFGAATGFGILVFAVVAPAGVLKAQESFAVREGVPVQAEAASGEGVAVKAPSEEVVPAEAAPEELTDEEIQQLLSKESLDRFGQWRRRRGHKNKKKQCSDFNGVDGPTKPSYVYCDPAEVPAKQVELYRENQRQQGLFINEPQIKF
ncbi:MAG: hypothetical protein O7I42_21885 [Alphaproteobacteria bacterium]|nr:hypothetical protein [Alphaproteobacteria bacterium]